MSRHRDYLRFVIKICADSVTVLIAWFVAYYLRFNVIPGAYGDPRGIFIALAFLVLPLYLYFLNRNKLYDSDIARTRRTEAGKIFYSSFQVFLFLTVFLYFAFPQKVSRVTILLYFVIAVFFLMVERYIVSSALAAAYRKGRYVQKVLLVGHGIKLGTYVRNVRQNLNYGFSIVGQYDCCGDCIAAVTPVDALSLADAVKAVDADIVVIAYPGTQADKQNAMINQAVDLLEPRVVLLPSLPESYIGNKIVDFHWLPALYLNYTEPGFLKRAIKRGFDVVASSCAVAVLSPFLAIIALLVKLSSPGPVLYKQQRITENGRVFTMYKFRSMRADMPETGEAHWTKKGDPRITSIGAFLRRTSIDELPQLFNVIGGSMSLIGPRPERPELVAKFEKEIPGYRLRHKMKTGISGWAQVNGWRGDTSLERRIEFDLYYIRNWGLLFDVKIVFLTFFHGFLNKNAY